MISIMRILLGGQLDKGMLRLNNIFNKNIPTSTTSQGYVMWTS